MATEERNRVIFRTYKSGEFEGDVLAVFPDIPGAGRYTTCYAAVGQHHDCDYHGAVLPATRQSTEAEAAPLMAELRSIGYKLRPVRRFTRRRG